MFTNRLRRLVAPALLLCSLPTVKASPVSYDFSGTLKQPFNGASTFSGTMVYDTDLPLYPGIKQWDRWAYYSGASADPSSPLVSLTFRIGDVASSSFGPDVDTFGPEVIVTHTVGKDGYTDEFNIEEQLRANGVTTHVGVGFLNNQSPQKGPFDSTAVPGSLSLSSFNWGGQLNLYWYDENGAAHEILGTITSLVPTGGTTNPGGLPNVPPPPVSSGSDSGTTTAPTPTGGATNPGGLPNVPPPPGPSGSDPLPEPVPEPASFLVFIAAGAEVARRFRG